MAYNENTADRIRSVFFDKEIAFTEKRMFSGICFMVDDKMCCGTHIDKHSGEDYLLCRIGEEAFNSAIELDECIPMNFTGREMIGYVYVLESGISSDKKLAHWLQLCLDFNPIAKKSKKK